MENFSFEAIMIGVNVLVFSIALSVAMTLMGGVNEMVEFTKEEAEAPTNGNLLESLEVETENIFTGAQIYSLYSQIKLEQISAKVDSNDHEYEVVLKINGNYLIDYMESYGIAVLKKEYVLNYGGKDGNNKDIYIFTEKAEET